MFLGGSNYREIAAQIGLTVARVEGIVKKELAASAKRRLVLTDQALSIYQERWERLYAMQLARAESGDGHAAAICERMLARHARLYGLGEEINPAPLPAPTSTTAVPADEGGEPEDELAKLRSARTGP